MMLQCDIDQYTLGMWYAVTSHDPLCVWVALLQRCQRAPGRYRLHFRFCTPNDPAEDAKLGQREKLLIARNAGEACALMSRTYKSILRLAAPPTGGELLRGGRSPAEFAAELSKMPGLRLYSLEIKK